MTVHYCEMCLRGGIRREATGFTAESGDMWLCDEHGGWSEPAQKSARAVMRSSYVYDKTRPKGQQGVARIEGAVGEDGSAIVMFGCQRADEEGKVCWLSKQHAIEFASSMLMIALSLPGDIPAGDMSMAADDWPTEPEAES